MAKQANKNPLSDKELRFVKKRKRHYTYILKSITKTKNVYSKITCFSISSPPTNPLWETKFPPAQYNRFIVCVCFYSRVRDTSPTVRRNRVGDHRRCRAAHMDRHAQLLGIARWRVFATRGKFGSRPANSQRSAADRRVSVER